MQLDFIDWSTLDERVNLGFDVLRWDRARVDDLRRLAEVGREEPRGILEVKVWEFWVRKAVREDGERLSEAEPGDVWDFREFQDLKGLKLPRQPCIEGRLLEVTREPGQPGIRFRNLVAAIEAAQQWKNHQRWAGHGQILAFDLSALHDAETPLEALVICSENEDEKIRQQDGTDTPSVCDSRT